MSTILTQSGLQSLYSMNESIEKMPHLQVTNNKSTVKNTSRLMEVQYNYNLPNIHNVNVKDDFIQLLRLRE
jgi:uncharacterized protein involved in tolerance to divalent cations